MNKKYIFSRIDFIKTKNRRGKLDLVSQINFTSKLSFLLNSGIPLLDSLNIIEAQTKNKKKKNLYKKLIDDISNGKSLSGSLKSLIGNFSFSVIHIGENSGSLGPNLSFLSDHLKKKREVARKVKQALIYPSLIILATVVITVFLLVYIFPKLLPVIKSLDRDLPLATRFVIFISGLATSYWIHFIVIFSFLVLFTVLILKKNQKSKFLFDKFLLSVPFASSIYKDFLFSNFCRSQDLLLKGGLTIDKCLEMTADTTSNLFLQSKILEMNKSICLGGNLSDFLSREASIFPSDFSEMVAVGEKTGDLSKIFENLSGYYDLQLESKIKNLSITVEPVLMIIAGLIVGLVAVSIIAPIYEITNSLQRR